MTARGVVARLGTALFVVAIAGPTPASGQSLGDVAKREAERRKEVASGRTYTNNDLTAVESPAPPPPGEPAPAGAAAATETPSTSASPGATDDPKGEGDAAAVPKRPVEPRETRNEQYWRGRAKDLRSRQAAMAANIAGSRARLEEIDAGPQSPAARSERGIVVATLERLQRQERFLIEDAARFEAFARSQKVPPDWIR